MRTLRSMENWVLATCNFLFHLSVFHGISKNLAHTDDHTGGASSLSGHPSCLFISPYATLVFVSMGGTAREGRGFMQSLRPFQPAGNIGLRMGDISAMLSDIILPSSPYLRYLMSSILHTQSL